MILTVYRNEREAAAALAERMTMAVRERPRLVLGLATGRTPRPLYERLVAQATQGRLDFRQVTTFNLDEFWRLPPTDPGSYRTYMERHLFAHVPILPASINFLDGMAENADAECVRYEAAIAAAGGIDLQILGIGANGHIGFNEPGPALQARTHRATLKPSTRRANAVFFDNDIERVPAAALSMGMATILQAREIVLMAMGRGKGPAVEAMVHGALTTRLPASFLQVHPKVEVLLDRAAASKLRIGAGTDARS